MKFHYHVSLSTTATSTGESLLLVTAEGCRIECISPFAGQDLPSNAIVHVVDSTVHPHGPPRRAIGL